MREEHECGEVFDVVELRTYLSTSHDTGQIIICLERRFMGFPHNSKRRSQSSETANWKFRCSRDTNGQPGTCCRQMNVQLKESPTFFNGV
jgi:hypothetical protein